MSCSYYFPDLTDRKQVNSVLSTRMAWMNDMKENHDDQIIRFRKDFKDCEFLFLCDVWPDVNNQRPTCVRWGIPVDKFPLLSVNKIGSFRTLRHFYYFNMFQTFDPSFACYFVWSCRHEAAKVYQAYMSEEIEKKIEKEKKKAKPRNNLIEQWKAEWHLILQNGLPAKEAIRLASWKCYKLHKKVNMTADQFAKKVEAFRVKNGIQVYAFGITQMYAQDERLKKALIDGTKEKSLFSVGNFKKEMWSTNSGHNLLGELHMHFRRNPSLEYFDVYSKKQYCYETAAVIHPSVKTKKTKSSPPQQIILQQQQSPSSFDIFNYYKTLCHEMNQEAEKGNWKRVRKLAQSIEYLTKIR